MAQYSLNLLQTNQNERLVQKFMAKDICTVEQLLNNPQLIQEVQKEQKHPEILEQFIEQCRKVEKSQQEIKKFLWLQQEEKPLQNTELFPKMRHKINEVIAKGKLTEIASHQQQGRSFLINQLIKNVVKNKKQVVYLDCGISPAINKMQESFNEQELDFLLYKQIEDVDNLETSLQQIKNSYKNGQKPELILIDFLTLLVKGSEKDRKGDSINKFIKKIRSLADKLYIPIVFSNYLVNDNFSYYYEQFSSVLYSRILLQDKDRKQLQIWQNKEISTYAFGVGTNGFEFL